MSIDSIVGAVDAPRFAKQEEAIAKYWQEIDAFHGE
jgi:hypothetical protein